MKEKPCHSVVEAATQLFHDVTVQDVRYRLTNCSITRLNDGSGWVWSSSYSVSFGNIASLEYERNNPEEPKVRIRRVAEEYLKAIVAEQRRLGYMKEEETPQREGYPE